MRVTTSALRNMSILLAAVAISVAPVEADQTCAQAGFEGIGPGCQADPDFYKFASIVSPALHIYAGGMGDCATECVLRAGYWCTYRC